MENEGNLLVKRILISKESGIEDAIIDNFHVKEISEKDGKILVTLKNRKYKSFQAISKLSNNKPLLAAMEACESIKLKVSIGSDSNGEVVEADIYEIING